MVRKIINVNKMSFISLLLCFVMLFSILAPAVSAVANSDEDARIEQEYQKLKEEIAQKEIENGIVGKVVDFSKYKFDDGTTTYGDLAVDHYQIKKENNNYIITLRDLTAKKIILPVDDADKDGTPMVGSDGVKYTIPSYTGKARENSIIIKLEGTNTVTGYGIQGYPVKGIRIEGAGDLTVNAFSEEIAEKVSRPQSGTWVKRVESTTYTRAGISVETGDRTYKDKDTDLYADENSLVFAGTGNITIKAPGYYGLTNNGDIKFKSGNIKIESARSAIDAYRTYVDPVESSSLSLELKSGEKIFYDKPTFLGTGYYIMASKSSDGECTEAVNKEEMEKSYESYRQMQLEYADDQEAPTIKVDSTRKFKEEIVEENEDEDLVVKQNVYCMLPTITVEDDVAIDSVYMNGSRVTKFAVDTKNMKKFVVYNPFTPQKEIVVKDVMGKTSKVSFKAYNVHKLGKAVVKDYIAPTCITNGFVTKEYYCTICGELVKTEKIMYNTIDHKFNEWEVKEDNTRERSCTVCGYTEKEDLVKSISNATVSLSTSKYTYDGMKKEPSVTVKDGNKMLAKGKDYTVAYSNNIVAGTAKVKVTGINNYKNTVSETFTIVRKSNKITAKDITREYSDKEQTFSIGAKQEGDATLSYRSDNSAVKVDKSGMVTIREGFSGKATITITADETEGYKSATKEVTITVKVKAPTIEVTEEKATKEARPTKTVVAQDTSTTSASAVSTANKTAASTTTAKKATTTTTVKKVTVKKVNNKITASNFTKKYSTKAQSFSIKAKQKGNAKLTYSSNNKNVKVSSSGKVTIAKGFIGKATITIKSKATTQYNSATKKITVTVNPPTVKLTKLSKSGSKKMKINWSKSTAVTGYQIQYSTDKNFKKNVKTVKITKNSTTSKTVSKLTKNKKYYVRIRTYKTVSGVKYYSGWSSIKNIKIK